jgi:hypothetical protein
MIQTMRLLVALAAIGVMAGLGGRADAGLITYTETATASGKLGSDSFSSALITFSGTGDTSGITQPIKDLYVLDLQSLNVSVAGVGSAMLTDQIVVEADAIHPGQDNAGFFDATLSPGAGQAALILSTLNSIFATYELATPIGPVDGAADFVNGAYKTTAGVLVLDSVAAGSTQFRAVAASAVPEPSSLTMLGLGLFVAVSAAAKRIRRQHRWT